MLGSVITWRPFSLPQAIASVAFLVLFLVFADIARRFGKAKERTLFPTTNGQPFPTVLRHSDHIIDGVSKARFIRFLSDKLGEPAPTEEQETREPATADTFYGRCGQWLRERTRDTEKFRLIFEENVIYGFRRNLYGLKRIGLGLNLLVLLAAAAVLHKGWTDIYALSPVLVIAIAHAFYFLLAVSKASVLQASDQYGRQLVLACETLMKEKASKKNTS